MNRDAPPPSANVLARWLDETANESGVAVGRLRRQLGFMVLAAMLDTAQNDDGPVFLVKGGVAMELRTGGAARATKDFDTAMLDDVVSLADHLDPALRRGFGDFSARRTEIEPIRSTGALRCEIKIAYRRNPVVTIPLETAAGEPGIVFDAERVPALSLTHLGLDGPVTVACLGVRWQIAQKLHACTERPVDRPNDRFRDLVDLHVLGGLVRDTDWPLVRHACVSLFEARGGHAWPPELNPPEHWREGYGTLVADIGGAVPSFGEAVASIARLVQRINEAG